MNYGNRRPVVITLGALVLLIIVVSCIVVRSRPSGTPAPTSTEQVKIIEDDDFICEPDDHPNEPECRGVRKTTAPAVVKPTTKPVVTPPRPRNTRR